MEPHKLKMNPLIISVAQRTSTVWLARDPGTPQQLSLCFDKPSLRHADASHPGMGIPPIWTTENPDSCIAVDDAWPSRLITMLALFAMPVDPGVCKKLVIYTEAFEALDDEIVVHNENE